MAEHFIVFLIYLFIHLWLLLLLLVLLSLFLIIVDFWYFLLLNRVLISIGHVGMYV